MYLIKVSAQVTSNFLLGEASHMTKSNTSEAGKYTFPTLEGRKQMAKLSQAACQRKVSQSLEIRSLASGISKSLSQKLC